MDNQIQNLLNLGINLNKFYSIEVRSCDIILQGWVTSSLMNDLNVLGYEFDYIKENNWFHCRKGNVRIVLTLNY
jgi:hypothetical protein